MNQKPRAQIRSTGRYIPKDVLTNAELIARFELPIDPLWIESRTGIQERHWMGPEETTSDMLVAAGRAALEAGGCEPKDLDRILVATISPDYPSPATATIVARKLGARCTACDLSAACAGFLYGLEFGNFAVAAGEERVLVLAGDARSRFVDRRDVRSVVLFADGAGAALLEPAPAHKGLIQIWTGAEGRERMGAHIPAGGAARPTSQATLDAGMHFLAVDGKQEIFELFVRFTREACTQVLGRAGLTLGDVDLFITHQGNARMVELTLKELGIAPERAVNNVAFHGNTSAGTLPIALDEARRSGRIRSGDLVLLTSVGAGYVFGAALHRF